MVRAHLVHDGSAAPVAEAEDAAELHGDLVGQRVGRDHVATDDLLVDAGQVPQAGGHGAPAADGGGRGEAENGEKGELAEHLAEALTRHWCRTGAGGRSYIRRDRSVGRTID